MRQKGRCLGMVGVAVVHMAPRVRVGSSCDDLSDGLEYVIRDGDGRAIPVVSRRWNGRGNQS